MLIVDAQVHIWKNNVPGNPSHRQIPDFTKEDLLKEMDEAGIDAAIIHPPQWDPDSDALASEAAKAHPNRLSILGKFPLDKPESRELIDGWLDQPGMLGLRFAFTMPHQQTWSSDGTMDWLWPEAERAGIPVGLMASTFMPLVHQVAERHPNLKLIVDHLGRVSGRKDEEAFGNLQEMLNLAKFPNVAIKATGAPSYSSGSYPFTSIHDYLHRIYDAFGPERMFWGTDITRMPCSWKECVTLFTEELPWLSEADKELVMGQAVCNWLGWKIKR
ncbi:MAG TPA: amidohydrolase [Dehalococcoidia bacterium]|nr:amidohydrolase [Dehalococcoidia bacterium]